MLHYLALRVPGNEVQFLVCADGHPHPASWCRRGEKLELIMTAQFGVDPVERGLRGHDGVGGGEGLLGKRALEENPYTSCARS